MLFIRITYKSVLFDLDNSLLDRVNSLAGFCHWQTKSSLGINNTEKFVERFGEPVQSPDSPHTSKTFHSTFARGSGL